MKKFRLSPGRPLPLGATITPEGVNFAVFSRHAEQVTLLLFRPLETVSMAEITLDPELNRTGDIWCVLVHDLDPASRYAYRMAGPYDPQGSGHYFNPENILLDPYARAISGGEKWGRVKERSGGSPAERRFQRRCLIDSGEFDWQGDRPLNIPLKDSIIYEMHVRGFTRHETSGVRHPGTYDGIIEKIGYLQELGVTAVELMPVTEFNENENVNVNPRTGERLKNFWGYSTLAFFAPKAAYAVDGTNGKQVREFKEMVKALHRAGIEVILDMVFNHTAEGQANGPVYSFRGIDNPIYYLLDPGTRDYLNFTGCGNTVNCNHPLVRNLIMDCLHYWVMDMHVDGFRFDLASILGRDQEGKVLSNPPVVEQIAEDPVLANTKIIAEAWDAAGAYQVGSFSSSVRWAEWNGKFRDDVRAFICGHENTIPPLASRVAGSSDLYERGARRPFNSINFVTCHDGFTLHDLVSYNRKHNISNGEGGRDGSDHEISWNSGHEGESGDPEIVKLRARRLRTLAAVLFLSQGVPMFMAGDEFARTQGGNNNPYCQDNSISWLDWSLADKNADLLRYFRLLIALRKRHPVFRRASFFPGHNKSSLQEIRWQAERPGVQNWSPAAKTLAFFLDGRAGGDKRDDDFFIALNGHRGEVSFVAPPANDNRSWLRIIDTAAPSPRDIVPEAEGIPIKGNKIKVAGMGAVVLIGKEAG